MYGRSIYGSFNPPGGFEAFGTLGLVTGSLGRPTVSIRRADLRLSEPSQGDVIVWPHRCFNPPGGFEAFGTRRDFSRSGGGISYVSIRRADLRLSEPNQSLRLADQSYT
ncbi:hypothetical protein OSCT_0299 [Oscillochloris trichoides DG-6]|uniref:Uncharacterized protein n=1 Tax=Oscillochloris trichoides DG-6 TaxID=765420 RepID=E1IAE8_9CHLR|nr:hypothetical protein OSCT_0299 [Oscillochloris trichoides DG-6]